MPVIQYKNKGQKRIRNKGRKWGVWELKKSDYNSKKSEIKTSYLFITIRRMRDSNDGSSREVSM